MTSRYENSQRILWNMKYACFFLSLLSVAEDYLKEKVDILDAARMALNKNWMDPEFTIRNDCEILKWLTGKKVTKEVINGECPLMKSNQFSIAKYEYNGGNHFRRRYFDVYRNSQTVEKGVRLCYYVYTIG